MTPHSNPLRRRLPLRVRLVAGFATAMLVLLTAAGAFVFWRVRYALDLRLDEDLRAHSSELVRAVEGAADPTALAFLPGLAGEDQILDRQGRLLARSDSGATSLLTTAQVSEAAAHSVQLSRGSILKGDTPHLRIKATPAMAGGVPVVVVAVVRLDQRDEALRELLAQIAVANLVSLVIASAVGYRLARAALAPVEAYRTRAADIANGATGVRLDLPPGPDDEVRRLGQTLNDMLDAQDRSAERQRQFVVDASHELRTPLTLLAGEVELALRRPRSASELEEALRQIRTDTTRLVALADDLLTLGAQGSRTAVRHRLLVGPLLDQAAARGRALLPDGSGRAVIAECPDGLEVFGDEALLQRALGNLVDNAVTHGAGTVHVSARAHAAAGVTELTVHDDGPGMPTDFLPLATGRFAQASAARGGGTGLGLSLVEAIAVAHGGRVRLCANGTHHQAPGDAEPFDAAPCAHAARGTTVTLLLGSVA